MKTETVKISELKPCPKLRALRKTNFVFVSRYRQAYRSGAVFPPPIVQKHKGGYRIISGIHRWEAMMAEFGKGYECKVIVKEYASEREVLEDFVRENADHGNALDGFTRRRLAHELLKENASAQEVAALFNIAVQRIEQWEGVGKVIVMGPQKQQTEEFVKRGFEPKGGTMTKAQYVAHLEADRGLSVVQQATQLTRWLKQNAVTLNDENIKALVDLSDALNAFLERNQKTA